MAGPWEDFKGSAAKTPSEPGPWDDFAQEDPVQEPSNPSAARAAARNPNNKAESAWAGYTQGMTFGYTPQIVANLANLGGKVQDMFRGEVINPATGKPIDRVDYIQARDATANDLTKARDDNPFTYGAGAVAGALALPTGAVLRGAGTAARYVGAAKTANALTKLGGPLKTAWGAAGRGALYGGLSNPGETEGEISPFQPVERGVNAVLGAGMGAVAKGWANAAGRATRGQRAAKELDSPGAPLRIKGEIQDTLGKMQERHITPLSREAKAQLRQKDVKFNPNILENADEPALMAALIKRTPKAQKLAANEGMAVGTGVKPTLKPEDSLVTLRGDVADRIRSRLARKSDIKQQSATGNPKVAESAKETKAASDYLRELRRKEFPETNKNFADQSYSLGLKKELGDKSKNAIETLTAAPGGTPYAKLLDVDKRAGSNLAERGADLRRGQYLLGQEVGQFNVPTSKMGFISRAVRGTGRAASTLGATPVDVVNRRVIDPLTGGRGLSEAFIRQLVEQIARSK